MLLAGRLHHNNNPVLTFGMGNVMVKPDANGNVFPRKESDDSKIDPAIAGIIASNRAYHYAETGDLPSNDFNSQLDAYLADFVSIKA